MLLFRRALIKLYLDCQGQDLIEYALMGALVACTTGVVMPDAAAVISGTFSKVTSNLVLASSTS